MSRNTELYRKASDAIPGEDDRNFVLRQVRNGWCMGYEQAEKATIERAIAWLKEHANEYIVDLTPTYPDAPVNIIVGGMCWEHLKDYLEGEGCQG